MFDNVPQVIVNNSQLVSADVTHNYIYSTAWPPPLDLLKEHIVLGALYDSAERYDPPKCHPKTRIALLDKITSWANENSNDTSYLLWLCGAAGAGKSAIAQSLSERFFLAESLAATFCFSRTAAGRNQSNYLVPTLAYQIARSIPITRPYIENAVLQDGRLFDKPLKDQFMALIIRPLTAPYTTPIAAKVIVIDGLDECCIDYPYQSFEAQHREMLNALSLLSEFCVPLKVLITSRPEQEIRSSIGNFSPHGIVKITLDKSQNPDADIEVFVRSTLEGIRRKHGIEKEWPGEEIIQALVRKSSGHFVYAAAVMRYISNPRDDPRARLKVILGLTKPKNPSHNPFEPLDTLYLFVMRSIQQDSLPIVRRVFEIMTSPHLFDLNTPIKGLTFNSATFFSKLMFMTDQQIRSHLIDLYSILDIPDASNSAVQPITFLHASFSEFLANPNRSGIYHVDPRQARLHCAQSIAKHSILARAQGFENQRYSLGCLRQILIRCVDPDRCPPSRRLRLSIHALIGGERRCYKAYLAALGLPRVIRKRSMRPELSRGEQLVVLTYLQRCNTTEIEKSSWRRWLMDASLVGQKARIRTLQVIDDHRTTEWIFGAFSERLARSSKLSDV